MSYIKDKEKMNRDVAEHRQNVIFLAKTTFAGIFAMLVLFCVALVGTLIFGDITNDKEAPVIIGPEGDVYVGYLGEPALYKQMVSVSDNSGNYDLQVDYSKVNLSKVGNYKVLYTATDKAGNVAEYTLIYTIKKAEYSEDALMKRIGEIAYENDWSKSMSKKELVREIYKYVQTYDYVGDSNLEFESRNTWRTDWLEEAVLTLDAEGGDCYSYYSLSVAFFEYFDINYDGIRRSKEGMPDGTHFWCVVEIEEGWYYYDATHLAGRFGDGTRNACLVTAAKLKSYVPTEGQPQLYVWTPVSGITVQTKELE